MLRRARVWCDNCDTKSRLDLFEVTLMPEIRSYRFRCPECDTIIVRSAPTHVVYTLLEHGDSIRIEHVTPPIIDAPSFPPVGAGEWVEAHDRLDEWIAVQLRHGDGSG